MAQPEWIKQGARHVWRPYCQMKTAAPAFPVVRTHDCRLVLADGRELVDGVAAWWTMVHGYNHPHLVDAVKTQADIMPHIMMGGLIHEGAAKLAARLASHLPGTLSHVFYSDSGSVAVEVAMKMAAQYWLNAGVSGKTKFVAFKGGYHGDTFATMAVCDPAIGMHKRFDGLLARQFIRDLPEGEESTKALDDFLGEHAYEIAAIVVEPLVQGAGGMKFQHVDVPKRLRQLADKHNILLIFDEIFVGMGRLGTWVASDLAETVPDIITLGKGLTGGMLPMAATVASDKVFAAFQSDDPLCALMHGPTFMGNALACAAANASLDLFEDEPRLWQAHELAQEMAPALGGCMNYPWVREVRVRGGVAAVELTTPIADPAALTARFADMGVYLRPFGNVIYLTPPLTIAAGDLARLTQSVCQVVKNPQ